MYPYIQNIAHILYDRGVRNVVISPGSRNAPLTIAFVCHGGFNVNLIYDERSAGFVALGQAIASLSPTVLLCTSGTASVNYYPAICEAFYQEIPLIILTADRPQEWIDQGDGQSIRQRNLFENHILKSFELLPDYQNPSSYFHLQRSINECFTIANNRFHRGPVHVNIPFREPFYPNEIVEKIDYRTVQKHEPESKKLDKKTKELIQEEIKKYSKILVFKGQELEDSNLTKYAKNIAIAKDVMGMACNTDNFLTMHDFLFNKTENLPDLIITMGKNFLSKPFKNAIRNANLEHWHLGTEYSVPDVFGKLTRHISCSPKHFFNAIEIKSEDYRNNLYNQELNLRSISSELLSQNKWTEFLSINKIINKLPNKCNLHISNSMPIRYLNHLQYLLKNHNVYANRGTSGIDGSISTAIGIASLVDEEHFIITGDLSFFYDRNGLWNNISKENVNIILLNNHGGGIFDIIKGPNEQKLIDIQNFTTPQNLNAKNTAKDFGMDYFRVNNSKDLDIVLKEFLKNKHKNGQILEIHTQIEENTSFYKDFLLKMKK